MVKILIKFALPLLVVYCILSTIAGIVAYRNYRSEKQNGERLSGNQEALMGEIEYYKTESGKNAAKVTELQLTKDEFTELCDEQKSLLKDLGIKVKRLESMTSVGTNTNIGFSAPIKDTIVTYVKDTVIIADTLKFFEWSDAWNNIEGHIMGNDVECVYNGYDTLSVVAERIPKKFLWIFKYGTKRIDISVTNSNPKSHITHINSISIKK